MPTNLNIFSIAGAKARHAAFRHALIAENVANADTPGYRSRDLEPFVAALTRMTASPNSTALREVKLTPIGASSPNGNTVSLEDEMIRASQAARDHEIASTVYEKSLAFLRAALGRK